LCAAIIFSSRGEGSRSKLMDPLLFDINEQLYRVKFIEIRLVVFKLQASILSKLRITFGIKGQG